MNLLVKTLKDALGVNYDVAGRNDGSDNYLQGVVIEDGPGEFNLSRVSGTTSSASDTNTGTAAGFPSLPADARRVVMSVEGDSIRWLPNADPDPGTGILLFQGAVVVFAGDNADLANWRFITTGTSSTINCVYGT